MIRGTIKEARSPVVEAPSPVERSALLEAFRDGDANAVRALYRSYGRLVYAVAHRTLGHPALAEAATQQTFLDAWRAADRVDAERDPASWLRMTLGHAVANDGATVDASWRVRRAIDALSAEDAVVVRLQHLDGMTQQEIATKLRVGVETVASRSLRAHRHLGALLGDLARA